MLELHCPLPTTQLALPASEAARAEQPRPMSDTFDSLALDAEHSMPLWRQLYAQLDALLASGRVREGASLPPERDLAEALGVSRATVKRSYDQLRHDRRLGGRGRAGSVVRAQQSHPQHGVAPARGFVEDMRERGQRASCRLVGIALVRDARIAAIFGRAPGARLLQVERAGAVEGRVILRELAWYDVARAPRMRDWDGGGTAHEQLRRVCGLALGRVEQTLQAVLSTAADAAAFGLAAPQPCLRVSRLTRLAAGAPVEYLESTYRGDAYAHRLDLHA